MSENSIKINTDKKAVLALRIISAVMLFPSVTGPLLAYIIQSYPKVPIETVTSILTIPSLVGIFVSFLIGPLALKINKKYLLIFTVLSTLFYFYIFIFVGSSGPFIVLLIAAGILGVSRGAGNALINSSIADFVEPEKRAANIAVCMALMQGGSAVVAIIGGRIAAVNDGLNWPNAHYLGFLAIPAIIIFWILMPKKPYSPIETESRKQDVSPGETANKSSKFKINIKVLAIIALNFIFMICFSAYFLNSSIYIILEFELGTSATAGMVSSTFTILGVIVGFSYKIWARIFRDRIVTFGYTLFIVGFIFMLTITTHIIGIWVSAALFSIGFNFSHPYIASKLMEYVSKKNVPIAMACFAGFSSLGIFLAPYVLRFLGGFFGGGLVGSLSAAVAILPLCVIATLFLFTVKKKRTNCSEPL